MEKGWKIRRRSHSSSLHGEDIASSGASSDVCYDAGVSVSGDAVLHARMWWRPARGMYRAESRGRTPFFVFIIMQAIVVRRLSATSHEVCTVVYWCCNFACTKVVPRARDNESSHPRFLPPLHPSLRTPAARCPRRHRIAVHLLDSRVPTPESPRTPLPSATHLANTDTTTPARPIRLGSHDLVIERAEREAKLLPRGKVVGRRDAAARAVRLADGPEFCILLVSTARGTGEGDARVKVAVPTMEGALVRVAL